MLEQLDKKRITVTTRGVLREGRGIFPPQICKKKKRKREKDERKREKDQRKREKDQRKRGKDQRKRRREC